MAANTTDINADIEQALSINTNWVFVPTEQQKEKISQFSDLQQEKILELLSEEADQFLAFEKTSGKQILSALESTSELRQFLALYGAFETVIRVQKDQIGTMLPNGFLQRLESARNAVTTPVLNYYKENLNELTQNSDALDRFNAVNELLDTKFKGSSLEENCNNNNNGNGRMTPSDDLFTPKTQNSSPEKLNTNERGYSLTGFVPVSVQNAAAGAYSLLAYTASSAQRLVVRKPEPTASFTNNTTSTTSSTSSASSSSTSNFQNDLVIDDYDDTQQKDEETGLALEKQKEEEQKRIEEAKRLEQEEKIRKEAEARQKEEAEQERLRLENERIENARREAERQKQSSNSSSNPELLTQRQQQICAIEAAAIEKERRRIVEVHKWADANGF